ncbi:MAG: hypothetical protein MJ196_07620 [Treponemataceae bacterium]|nr:hypothetical protein [Treponemataceae bacterium]
MSERRMFSKSITESDAFLDLPFSAQALYFHLSMNADDEGFINNCKRLMRVIGASDCDFQALIEKAFVIRFESGICVIKHWKINNSIRQDRKRQTNYPEEKDQLMEKPTGVYTLRIKANREHDEKESTGEIQSIERVGKSDSLSTDEENSTVEQHYEEIPTETFVSEETEELPENPVVSTEIEQPRKDYAGAVFDVLYAHNLPCCNGNLVTFCMRDFKLALQDIAELKLNSSEVIQAVKNYAEVVEMKRRGLSWWNAEQDFYSFCKQKTITKFLPGTFKLENYLTTGEPGADADAEKKAEQMAWVEQMAVEENDS